MMQATQKTSPWSESPLGELITGTAFHPHPADLSRSLEERFAGRNILLLVLAKERAAVARVSFREGKAPTVATVRQLLRGQAGELASALAEEAARSQAAWVQVSLACGWQAYVARRSSSLFDAADAHQRRHLVREQASLLKS